MQVGSLSADRRCLVMRNSKLSVSHTHAHMPTGAGRPQLQRHAIISETASLSRSACVWACVRVLIAQVGRESLVNNFIGQL